jgi:hypothetical protein
MERPEEFSIPWNRLQSPLDLHGTLYCVSGSRLAIDGDILFYIDLGVHGDK